MPNTAVKEAQEILLITTVELTELAEWERKYTAAKKKVSEAEDVLKFRRLALAEKVLGIKTYDDLKALSPEQVAKRHARRLVAGDFRIERGAPVFTFQKTNAARYPAWARLYAEKLGETAAARVKDETPISFSYSVEVALPA